MDWSSSRQIDSIREYSRHLARAVHPDAYLETAKPNRIVSLETHQTGRASGP